MTPEQIKLLKKLQPFFKERMGELMAYDKLLFNNTELIFRYIHSANTHICCVSNNGMDIIAIELNSDCLRIPLAIDPVNPERGLCGMLDWKEWSISEYNTKGFLRLKNSVTKTVHIYNPYTALLKALCEQWEVGDGLLAKSSSSLR